MIPQGFELGQQERLLSSEQAAVCPALVGAAARAPTSLQEVVVEVVC